MDPRIRPVERDDAVSLAALRIQQDRERAGPTRAGFLAEYADALLEDFEDYRGWIAEEVDGRPVGCVLAQRVRKLPSLMASGRPEWWYVQQVHVSADRRRRGIGRALMAAVQQAAAEEEIRWIRLNSSAAGRPLFDAVGFGPPVDRLREWVPRSAG